MSSTSDERLMNVLGQAQQNLIKAKDPTPCVMISEENWKSIIETMQQQLEVQNRLGELIRYLPTDRQLVNYIDQVEDIHIRHEEKWMKQLTFEAEKIQADLENRSKTMEKEFQSQVGKLNEQHATELDKAKTDLEQQMISYGDRLYKRIIIPCLLMMLLSAVLVLLVTYRIL